MLKLLYKTTERFYLESFSYRVSALSFATIMALVPLLLVIVSFASIFPAFHQFITLSESYIIRNFIPTSADIIKFYVQGFVIQAASLPAISIFFLMITAVMLVNTIVDTLNDIWRTPKKSFRFLSYILYWLSLISIPLLIGTGTLMTSYLVTLSTKFAVLNDAGIANELFLIISIPINTLLFSLLYIIGPNAKVVWRDGLFGGFVAALLFELAKLSFVLYIEQFPNYALIYGAFAIIPIFLLWLYISWTIILYCAILTYTKSQMNKPVV